MRVVEPKEPLVIGIVQSERVLQTVWALRRGFHASNLEIQIVAAFIPVSPAVESQQELKGMLRNAFAYHVMIW